MKKYFYSFLFLSSLFIWGCIKKEASLPIRTAQIPAGSTFLKFATLSPDAPQVNFFANGKKVSSVAPTTANVEQGMVFANVYPATTGYIALPGGSLKIEAKVIDSSTVMAGQILSTTTATFAANKYYSIILVDSLSKLATLVVEDDPSLPDPTKAYYRLGNFTSNSPTGVNIEFVKTSSGTPFTKIYNNVPFKSISAFDTLAAGQGQVYKIFLRHPTSNAKLDSISAFTPAPSKKYTIYTRGVLGLTGTNAKRPIITSYTNF